MTTTKTTTTTTSRRAALVAPITLFAALLALPAAQAQTKDAADPFAEYREQLGDDNPATLWEARGELLWKMPRGTKNVSLERCDLGKGPGVIKGAYAALPRYFADTGRVQDMESRLLTCMDRLQGLDTAPLVKQRFGDGDDKRSDLEAIMAYLVTASAGSTMHVPFDRPEEKAAYELGKTLFYYRGGTHDFSCATCHSQDERRIRLQAVPNLATTEGAQAAYTTWPAYRISQGELRTMEWRIADCFRQQRFPELQYGSETAIALTMYMAKLADGGVLKTPALKR